MQTNFKKNQLENPEINTSEKILRKCVHCGMCNATCPTFQILGDELSGPRGRIYLIKDMLENNKPANKKIAKQCVACHSFDNSLKIKVGPHIDCSEYPIFFRCFTIKSSLR